MPFVNIRLVKEIIADNPEAKNEAIARNVVKAVTDATPMQRG